MFSDFTAWIDYEEKFDRMTPENSMKLFKETLLAMVCDSEQGKHLLSGEQQEVVKRMVETMHQAIKELRPDVEITIRKTARNLWEVRCSDLYEDHLGTDEALWCVVKLMADSRPSYLRTQKEREAEKTRWPDNFERAPLREQNPGGRKSGA